MDRGDYVIGFGSSYAIDMASDAIRTVLEQVLLDAVAGSYRILPWTTTSYPAWQRLAE